MVIIRRAYRNCSKFSTLRSRCNSIATLLFAIIKKTMKFLKCTSEYLVDDVDYNYKYKHSCQEPDGPPNKYYNYYGKNQQDYILNVFLDSHAFQIVMIS